MQESEAFEIEGIAWWAKLNTPDENEKYTVDISVDDDTEAYLKTLGLSTRTKDTNEDMGSFITCWKHAVYQSGDPAPKPLVVDADANAFDDNIGNGSKVKVKGIAKAWKFKQKSGVRAELKGLQVVTLVPYGDVSFEPVTPMDMDS